jgi:hypothetical protein
MELMMNVPKKGLKSGYLPTSKKGNATTLGTHGGLKGHESIAQALAWVYIFKGSALKGRQKSRTQRCGIAVPLRDA